MVPGHNENQCLKEYFFHSPKDPNAKYLCVNWNLRARGGFWSLRFRHWHIPLYFPTPNDDPTESKHVALL